MNNENKIETNVIKPKLSFLHDEKEFIILNNETEALLDSKIEELSNYMANNHGRDEEEYVKDELYETAQELWHDYANFLRNCKFNFYIDRTQYNFLTDLIVSKLEYDVDTLFIAIELTNLMKILEKTKFNDNELKGVEVTATEITYIYHLISKHKVKGLSKKSYTFAEVLKKIADVSKVVNFYDTEAKNLNTEIQKWATSFTPLEEKVDDKVDEIQ